MARADRTAEAEAARVTLLDWIEGEQLRVSTAMHELQRRLGELRVARTKALVGVDADVVRALLKAKGIL